MTLRPLRARWRDGIKASDLSPKARLCALVIADWWPPRDGQIIWVELAALVGETGKSRRTVQYALRELEEAGWLQLAEPPRQHRPPGYRPSLPRGAHAAPLAPIRGSHAGSLDEPAHSPPTGAHEAGQGTLFRDADSAPLEGPRGAISAPLGEVAPSIGFEEQQQHARARARTPGRGREADAPASALAVAIRAQLPPALAAAVAASTLHRVSARAVDLGWTPELLRPVLAACNWSGAGPGAVIAWLRDLGPPTTSTSPRRLGCADCVDGWLAAAPGAPGQPAHDGPRRCPTCRPRHATGHAAS